MKNNKGFSLVELIIVIAIMAVLIGVLAPQYIRYVEKSKKQADISAVNEVYNALKICYSDPELQSSLAAGTVSISTANGVTGVPDVANGTGKLSTDLFKTVKKEIKLTSNTYGDSTFTIVITKSADGWDLTRTLPAGVEGWSVD